MIFFEKIFKMFININFEQKKKKKERDFYKFHCLSYEVTKELKYIYIIIL